MNKIKPIYTFNENNILPSPRADGIYRFILTNPDVIQIKLPYNNTLYSYHIDFYKIYNLFTNSNKYGIQLIFKRK
jgi:hypothetical protein